MFQINDDLSINITRGDTAVFTVNAIDESGEKHLFQSGDVIRIKVTEKKACENVMFQKDFVVTEETEQVEILLTEDETKIGEVISKPTDYWYEVELNPLTNPQTIIGYDEDGAKIFKLFPEGKDVEPVEPTPEDIPIVDEELDLTSERPVQNQAIARAFLNIQEEIAKINIDVDESVVTQEEVDEIKTNVATNAGKIEDLTNNVEELNNHKANTSNPHDVTAEQTHFDKNISGMSADNVQGAIDELKGTIGYTSPNLLPNTASTKTSENITYTVNDDKSVTANGTCNSSADHSLIVLCSNLTLKKGKYILSGCVGGSSTTYKLDILGSDGKPAYIDYGEGCEMSLEEDTTFTSVRIVVYGGVKVNNLVFKPMIRYASIEDDSYEPYVPSVNNRFVKKAYTLTLAQNSACAPFSYYARLNVADDVENYGEPISMSGFNNNGVPIGLAYRGSEKIIFVASGLASVDLYVIYDKFGTTLVS